MDYFSVNYQGLESIRQQEEKIYQILDGICEELFLIKSNVDVQPTLWGHGYGGKLWEAYSRTVTISSHVNRMRTGLGKVSDKYMEYEQKVLTEAEGIITVKNGFSKKAVKTAKAASDQHEKFFEKNQKNTATWKDVVYDATVGSWKENWGQMLTITKRGKTWAKEGWTVLRENGYEELENSDLPPFVKGLIKAGVGKLEGFASDTADILEGILDFTNEEAVKKGILGVVSILDPFELGGEDVVESVFDMTAEDSSLMQRMDEIQQRTGEALQDGNYLEAAVTFFGGGAETLIKGTTEVVTDWATAQVDGKLGKATLWTLGEAYTLEDLGEVSASHTGVNPGTIVADIGSDIGGGISSALDTVADWFGGLGL